MAQLTNFAIPARLHFRPYNALWACCRAEIVGWWDRPNPLTGLGSIQHLPLILGSLIDIHKLDLQGQKLGEKERVTISVAVPSAEDLVSGSGWLAVVSPSYTTEIYRDEIPVDVLAAHENRKNTPDIGGRHFPMLACPNREFAETVWKMRAGEVRKSAWVMRDEFFRLKRDTPALVRFLNRWGLWSYTESEANHSFLPFMLAAPERLWRLREKLQNGLVGSERAWMKVAPPLTFSQTERPPFIVERFSCEDAIQATITIDHLARLKFGICERNDCRNLFQRETAQKRLYCSTHCAHLANVRKLRAEKKKSQSKQKGKGNAKG